MWLQYTIGVEESRYVNMKSGRIWQGMKERLRTACVAAGAVLTAFVPDALCANESSGTGSTSAYSFLEIPTSVQVFSLGGVNISTIDTDLTLADQNPALIGPEIGMQAAFNYMHYLGSGNFAGVRYGMGHGERAAWACGIQFLDYGEFTRADEWGVTDGTFHPKDIELNGLYSHDFNDRLRGGINIKMIVSSYEHYSALAFAADLGLNYYNDEHDTSLSIVLKNMGGQVKRFDRAYNRLPFDIQAGWTQGIGSSDFSLSVTAWHLNKWKLPYYTHNDQNGTETTELKSSFVTNLMRHLVFGVQYRPSEKFFLGLGYNYKMRTDMATYKRNFLSGFSLGANFRVKSWGFGVAYAMPHKGGSEIMINISSDIKELLRR